MSTLSNTFSQLACSASQAVGTAGVIFVLYYVAFAFYLVYFHPLSKYSGPKMAAISRLPLAYSTITGNTWRFTSKLNEQYGSIVRIAPDEVSTT